MPKLKFHKPFIPSYVFAALILVGSSIPTYELDRFQRKSLILRVLFSDVIIHLVAFAVLTVLLSIAFAKTRDSKSWWIKAAGASFFVGWLVEMIQIFIPYRSFSALDLAVDLLGIAVALVIFKAIRYPAGPSGGNA